MADYVFVKNDAGIRELLKSEECLALMEKYARERAADDYIRPFIGFDRAQVFVEVEK